MICVNPAPCFDIVDVDSWPQNQGVSPWIKFWKFAPVWRLALFVFSHLVNICRRGVSTLLQNLQILWTEEINVYVYSASQTFRLKNPVSARFLQNFQLVSCICIFPWISFPFNLKSNIWISHTRIAQISLHPCPSAPLQMPLFLTLIIQHFNSPAQIIPAFTIIIIYASFDHCVWRWRVMCASWLS